MLVVSQEGSRGKKRCSVPSKLSNEHESKLIDGLRIVIAEDHYNWGWLGNKCSKYSFACVLITQFMVRFSIKPVP